MTEGDTLALADDPDAARAAAERLFKEVGEELERMLPPSAEIVHVGATAIPGCQTKGDLDIAVRVDPVDFSLADGRIAACFARNGGSVRTEDFAAFEDGGRTPHLGIQLTAKGGPLDVFHQFTDALRKNRDLVEQYNRLKLAFRGRPVSDYRVAKDAFVLEVLRK